MTQDVNVNNGKPFFEILRVNVGLRPARKTGLRLMWNNMTTNSMLSTIMELEEWGMN